MVSPESLAFLVYINAHEKLISIVKAGIANHIKVMKGKMVCKERKRWKGKKIKIKVSIFCNAVLKQFMKPRRYFPELEAFVHRQYG